MLLMSRIASVLVGWVLALSPFLSYADLEPDQASASSEPQGASENSSGCLSYEPSVVELRGTIVRETFPGPPDYESIRGEDRPEVYWLVVLSHPVCVDQDKTDPDLNPAQKDVRRIQLVFHDAAIYKTQKALVGKSVVAKGTLFGAHTGHHHTPVLLTVSNLKEAE
jgi:hypothetical protein